MHLKEIAKKINAGAMSLPHGAIDHARECGELLVQAKDQIGHGGFLVWLTDNCRVKPRQAQKYMRLARENTRTRTIAGDFE